MGKKTDVIMRAYARLKSLKGNLPKTTVLREKYVDEYSAVVSSLEKAGYELSEFKIPSSEVKPRVTSSNYITGETTYSDYNTVERCYLLVKLDGLLSYFELHIAQVAEPDRTVLGFKQPK